MSLVPRALLALFALIVGGIALSPAAAADRDARAERHHAGLSGEAIVKRGLASEGFDVEEISVDTHGIAVAAESASAVDGLTFELDLAAGSAEGTLTVADDARGAAVVYDVDVWQSTAERAIFDLTDPRTGETYHYDSSIAEPSIAFVIPIAFAAVSLGTALYWLAVGAAIVVSGVLLLEAAKAIDRILEENARRSAEKRRYYYPATRSDGKLYISGSGLSLSQALPLGRKGGDIWATSAPLAKSLARKLNPSGKPVGPEKHGSKYLFHFHPHRHTPEMHAFYGRPS